LIGQLPLHLELELTGMSEQSRQRFRDWVNTIAHQHAVNASTPRAPGDSPAGQLAHAPQVVRTLALWGQAGHWLPRSVIVPLSRQGITPDSPLGLQVIAHSPSLRRTTVNAAAPQTLQARYEPDVAVNPEYRQLQAAAMPDLGGFTGTLGDVIHGAGEGLKTATRYTTGALQSGAEAVSTLGARIAGPFTHPVETYQGVTGGAQAATRPGLERQSSTPAPGGYHAPTDSPFDLKQFTLSQMLSGKTSGSGFFPAGEAAQAAREQQARSRGTIDGHVATFGRLLASDVVEPGTQPYNILSGTVDGIINWKLDPAAIALTKLGDINESRKIFDTYGVYTNGVRKFFHGPTVEAFANSKSAEKYYQKVADETSITTLMRHTDGQYPAKLYADLVDARTPEQVKSLLVPHFGTEIRDVPSWGYGLKPSLSNVRAFNNMPHGVLDQEDLDHTLEQARRLMVTVKADPKQIDRSLYKLARADSPTSFYDAAKHMAKTMATTLERDYGMSSLEAERITRFLPDATADDSKYFVGAMGDVPHVPGVTIGLPVPGKPIPVDELGTGFFHGTSKGLIGDKIDPAVSPGSPTNLFGPGFYFTDNPNVALSYTKKGAKTTEIGMQGAVYKVAGTKDLRFLDATAPATPEIRDAFRAFYRESLGWTDNQIGDLLDGDTFDVLHGRLKGALRDEGMTTNEANEVLDSLNVRLGREGYDGIKYQGGARTGSERHNAFMVFDPEHMQVTDVRKPIPPSEIPQQVPITGPHLPSEFLNRALPMPNPRDLRAAASTWQKIVNSGVLLEDHPVLGFPSRAVMRTGHWTHTLADAVTQSIFKPFALIRGAWPVRVIGEEQIRLATAGNDSIFRHPIQYIAEVVGRHENVDAYGIPFDQLPGSELDQALSRPRGWRRMGPDPGEADKLYSRHFAPIPTRAPGGTRAWGDELSHLHMDEVAQHVAASSRDGDGLRAAKDWFRTSKYRDQMMGSGDWRETVARDHPDEYIESVWDRVRQTTAENPELIDAVADGANMRYGMRLNRNFVRKLDQLVEDGRAPQVVKGRIGITVNPSARDQLVEGWDRAVDGAFNVLMSKPTNTLSRGPAFKQFYWRRMAEQFGALDPDAQEGILRVARNSGVDKSLIKKMSKAAPGTLDLEHADMVAKAWALHSTKKLLYDATEKSHFMDAMRIVFPFGEAFKEVTSVWARLGREEPQTIRRAQQIIQGARGARIPGTPQDHGFFFTGDDGVERFTFPFSEAINKKVDGLPFPFQGSVQSLNIAGQGLPGVGPAVQIVADGVLPDTATFDGVRKALMPYGGPDITSGAFEAFFPGYAQRIRTEGGISIPGTNVKLPFLHPTPDQQRLYSNTVKQAMAYLYSTGAYNMTDREDMTRIQLDAKHMADNLYTVRSLAQFVAPAAPQVTATLNAKNGKLYELQLLTNDFKKMEKEDFNNAVPNFIDKYGAKAFLATGSFTQPTVYSPPTSKQEAWWAQKNADFVGKYGTVAGFFAPTGGNFDYDVYLRSIHKGQRLTLSPDAWLKAAEHRVASSIYAQTRAGVGANPTEQQQDLLRQLKLTLRHEYPGYDPDGTFSKLPSRNRAISDLQSAVEDRAVKKNPLTRSLKDYFEIRQVVIDKLKSAGFNSLTSPSVAPARAALREFGAALYERDVRFQPVWDYVLSGEVRD
jgi:hypothetical protein